ncbi:MAG: strictosidine synthase [Proteobacteria bacterium SG_bin4]|nr:MAG: strictosidine synthase [Proteobacteria bacterium SG_bin4]
MKVSASLLYATTISIIAYFCFWPVPIEPVSWEAPAAPGYTGSHARNERLSGLQLISLGGEEGPEHVALSKEGLLYTAAASGKILRMEPNGNALEVFVNTGGRVLGFDFDAAENLIAADAMRGVLKITPDREISVLIDHVNGDPIRYPNSIVVAQSGKIYITDSSTRFAPSQWGGTFEASMLDIVEQSASGRVLEYDPTEKKVRIVAKGLSFANGIALSQNELSLFVNETGRYRVWKIATAAENLDINLDSMQAIILLDNLPGYPDNLMRGLEGRIWLGFAKPRNSIIDFLSDKPFLRKLVLRFPRALWPMPEAYGHVMAFTESGNIVADMQDPSGQYPETTALTETYDRFFIQSLHANNLGWLARR